MRSIKFINNVVRDTGNMCVDFDQDHMITF